MHRKIVALVMAQKPDMVIQTGDLVRLGNQDDLWKIYDDITGDMRKKVPVYPARGNHDVGGAGYEERVTAPFSSGNKLYYSFDKSNCHFIALAIDEHSKYDEQSEQYQWLVKDLEATTKKKPGHIFVFFHVPPYSIGAHGSDFDVRKTLCPVFKKYGVQVVLTGHDHNYYHTIRDGITYIVTGGGGAPLYPVDPGKGAIEGDKYESVNNIVLVEVKGTLLSFTALRDNGTTIDRFSLTSNKVARH
jgi:3',5'-cyclic AMP phosphodiesterase CpdA